MAAGGWRNWAEGELVTEALFQDIQDSIAFIFASESAANTALTSKVEGTQFYDTGEDKLKIWNGSAWVAQGGGLADTDQWTLTAAVTSDTTISSNLSRISTENLAGEALGTGMSVSSGVWTFPSTGYWLVNVQAAWRTAADDGCSLEIQGTDDDSTYTKIGQANFGKANDNSNIDAVTFGQVWLKITDTSNDKIKFVTNSISAGSELRGSTTFNFTSFVFMKIGDI